MSPASSSNRIPAYHVDGGNHGRVTVPHHPGPGGGHGPEREDAALGLEFLDEAHRGIEDHDRPDRDRVGELPEDTRDDAAAEKEPDDGALELAREEHPSRRGLFPRDLVGAVLGEPAGGSRSGQTLGHLGRARVHDGPV